MKRIVPLASLFVAIGCGVDGPVLDDDAANPGGMGGIGGEGGAAAVVTTSSAGGMALLPESFTLEGVVVDENGDPVADAMVLQGGQRDAIFVTPADGTFSIEMTYPGYGVPGIVASKLGYRTVGADVFVVPDSPMTLTLVSVKPTDNPSYEYGDPGTGVGVSSTKQCGHCHATFARDFQLSKHKDAAKNPLVHDLYAGAAHLIGDAVSCATAGGSWLTGLAPGTSGTTSRCYLGGGVLPDLNPTCGGASELACDDPALSAAEQPTAFGHCADCHAPGITGTPGGRDLLETTGLAFDNGVFCDTCHKASDVDLEKPPGIGPDLRLVLRRPIEAGTGFNDYAPLMFGPLVDVPLSFMGASVQPKFDEAVFCAGCHQQTQAALLPGDTLDTTRWPDGLPVHSTYQEWQDGPYAASGTPCQFCHMPPHFELVNSIDDATIENASLPFGYPRPPEDRREHIFRGPLFDDGDNPRLVDTALFANVVLSLAGDDLDVTVHLSNIGSGHAVPTGEPMRSVLLLVTAEGSGCGQLAPTGGMTVLDVGGAHARAVEGTDATTVDTTLSWSAGAARAQAGMVVRAVRPTATFDDYDGIGLFSGSALTPQEKGLEIMRPVAEAVVVSAGAGQITLDAPLPVQAGDILYLGDAVPSRPTDGASAAAFAGAAGYAFARVLVDGAGRRQAPHYRAIDIASDNRIPPGKSQTSIHRFDVTGCQDATVRARVLYRPHPLSEADLRGWDARDYVIATGESTIVVP